MLIYSNSGSEPDGRLKAPQFRFFDFDFGKPPPSPSLFHSFSGQDDTNRTNKPEPELKPQAS
jgi:hypothetical protein